MLSDFFLYWRKYGYFNSYNTQTLGEPNEETDTVHATKRTAPTKEITCSEILSRSIIQRNWYSTGQWNQGFNLTPRANGRNIVGQQLPTSLGVVASVCTRLTGFKLNLRNNIKQGVQTEVTCNIQQCCELLVTNVTSVCTSEASE